MSIPRPDAREIHPLISARRSPRAFSEAPVSRPALSRLFEAARWAASCYNEQPWRFVVGVRGEGESWQKILETLVEANRVWAQRAPVLAIAVAADRFARNQKPNAHAQHDLGLALGNLSLQAVAEGLIVHPMAGFSADAARASLGIPEHHTPLVALAIGHEGDPQQLPENLRAAETAPRQRRPLGEVVFAGAWGRDAGLGKV